MSCRSSVVGPTFVTEGADWGSFLLLPNGGRAWVHLMEGPCPTARDADLTDTGGSVGLQDDVGVWHQAPFESTISREQRFRASRHRPPRGEKWPGLTRGRAEPSAAADGGRDTGLR